MAIIDKGWKRIKRSLHYLHGRCVDVGVIASLVGSHLVMIATANHFGTRRGGKQHIPPRPFLRHAYRKARRGLMGKRSIIARQLNALYRGRSNASTLLHEVGQFYQGKVIDTMQAFSSPANAPSTIRQKGFNDPLIESGKLVSEGIGYTLGRR